MKKANIDELKLSDVRPGGHPAVVLRRGRDAGVGHAQPRSRPRPHTHPHEQIVYIVSGHGPVHRRRRNGRRHGTVTCSSCRPGVLHYAVAAGDEPMVDLSVFNPRRDDYYRIDEGDPPAPDWLGRRLVASACGPWAARRGERLLGTFAKSRDPLISETLATAGYDFVVADLEHSSLSAG